MLSTKRYSRYTMGTMRRVFAYFSQPGRFIFFIAIIVLIGSAVLWRSMHIAPEGEVFPFSQPEETLTGQDAAIARALLDMAGMAFEESRDEPLEESVKQIDYALAQAMLYAGIPPSEAVIEKTELRKNALGTYHYQRVAIVVENDPRSFLSHLRDALTAWADGAKLAEPGSGEKDRIWTISSMGIVTHEIALHEERAARPGDAGETSPEGPGRILRRRAPGEPARLVIVMDDLGEDMQALHSLVNLPYVVTCAVWPRSSHARKAAETAHAAGREVLIHQPAEPMKYPEMNPGPGALFVSLSDAEIEARVKDSLTRVPYAVGMNNHMGSRFTRDSRSVAAMVRPLQKTGLFVLDSLTHPGSVLYKAAKDHGIPSFRRDIFLDATPSRSNVFRQLRKAEKIALVTGRAIVIGHPLPETLAALREWDGLRDPHIEIVTLSRLLESR